jgi:3-hydroxyanthranilate 3,4-dioxygenase
VSIQSGPTAFDAEFTSHTSEQWFYQLTGTLDLLIMDEGQPKPFTVQPGGVFLLPANVPIKCQRSADSQGFVVFSAYKAGGQRA